MKPPFVIGEVALHGSPPLVLAPAEPHADVEDEGYCAAHDSEQAPGVHWAPDGEFPRYWCVRGRAPVRAVGVIPEDRFPYASDVVGLSLAPGTRLRLDATGGGRYYDGGEHDVVTWRFCVLDGPWAGTCWEFSDAMPIPYDAWPISVPIEPQPDRDDHAESGPMTG
jgi:hypothetical protein